jgi:hypothetical protein
MSKLIFERKEGVLIIVSGENRVVGTFKAHNRTKENGSWRAGTYRYEHYNAHPELSGPSNAFDCWSGNGLPQQVAGLGCFGIHIFSVKGKDAVGIHSGRTEPPSDGNLNELGTMKTLGCIRVTPAAMLRLNEVHFGGDPIQTITLVDRP